MQTLFYSFKSILIASLLMLLSACGFHLKHNDGLVEKYPQIILQSTPNTDLTRLIKLRLRGAGIDIVDASNEGVTILKIGSERRSSRTISLYVTAQNAEQELGYNLNYSIQISGYEAQDFNINLYRDFLDDSEQALAKSRESELITKEFRIIAADHIINTMLSLNKNNSKSLNE